MNYRSPYSFTNIDSFIVLMYKHNIENWHDNFKYLTYTENHKKHIGIHHIEIRQDTHRLTITLELAMPYERSV